MNWTAYLGWNEPKPHHYARCKAGPAAADIVGGVVPAPKVDLSNLVSQILDQGALGSCTCNSWAQVVHAAMVSAGLDPSTPYFSRLFAYFCARLEDGNQAQDTGTQNCTVADALCRMGFPAESVWPYDVSQFAVQPSQQAVWAAFDQRAKIDTNYHRIDTVPTGGDEILTIMRQNLTAGFLFNFGGPVTNAFCAGEIGTTPDNPVVPPTGDIAGGHSMAVVGADWTLARPVFKVINSWGLGYGDNGYCFFDPSYFTQGCAQDMWTCRLAPRFSGGAQ